MYVDYTTNQKIFNSVTNFLYLLANLLNILNFTHFPFD